MFYNSDFSPNQTDLNLIRGLNLKKLQYKQF